MLYDFNLLNVSFVENFNESCARVVPYYVKEEEIIINKDFKKEVEVFFDCLNKKVGSIFSTYIKKEYFVFVCVKENDVESNIALALKSIPKIFSNIAIELKEFKFYDKLLVSKILFENKNEWTLKTNKSENTKRNVFLIVKNNQKHSIKLGRALAETQSFVQQLVNMPANYLTPSKFGEIIQDVISKENLSNKIACEVHGKDFILDKKMGSFYGVAKGSKEEPKLIVLKYSGAKNHKEKPIVLVGKGLTFDSGGISIKPSAGMDAMKGDMAGAATALSAVLYAAKAELPINLVAIAACCENMPSGESVKPGDVLTAMDGTTIEVLDTDAEGRLVLADALLFSQEFNGKYTIDMATLTGACIVALGYIHTGLFSKDENLALSLIDSGKKIKDLAWQLPLEEAHEEMLESKVADISNLCIGKGAGAQNGAVFLQRFAPKNGWCHLDIAGTSAVKGGLATSRPLAMISEFLDNQN